MCFKVVGVYLWEVFLNVLGTKEEDNVSTLLGMIVHQSDKKWGMCSIFLACRITQHFINNNNNHNHNNNNNNKFMLWMGHNDPMPLCSCF